MNNREKIDFKVMASLLMFDPKQFVKFIKTSGIKYRKGKGAGDVRNAHRKALKKGMMKVEFELDLLELYLQDVFMIYYIPQNK